MKEKKYCQLHYPWIDVVIIVLSSVVTVMLLKWMLTNVGRAEPPKVESLNVIEQFDSYIGSYRDISPGSDVETRNVFTLDDSTIVAPQPHPECYGQAADPGELQWLLEEAGGLLDGQ